MAKKKTTKKRAKSKKAAKPAVKKAPVHRPKKKESNKFLVWAVVVVVIVVLLFLIRGVKKGPEAPEAPIVEPEAPAAPEEEVPPEEEYVIPPTEEGVDFIDEEELETGDYVRESLIGSPSYEDEDLGTDLTEEPERFSNFECVIDEETGMRYVSIKITNTNSDVSFMISPAGVQKGYNTYLMINGLVDGDGLGCGIEELAPGESVVCDRIGLDTPKFEVSTGINRVNINSPNDEGKIYAEAVVVNCEE